MKNVESPVSLQIAVDRLNSVRREIAKIIVGQDDVVEGVLICLLASGHVLLEAMQERTVTSGTTTHELERPFLVMATQNPIEMEGTYPLPEAQLDRFLMKILVTYPNREELGRIVERTIQREEQTLSPAMDRAEI